MQVASYADYLRNCHSAFTEDGFALEACAYLHNMAPGHAASLRGLAYEGAIRSAPFFVSGDETVLAERTSHTVGQGEGMSLLPKVVHGRYKPSTKLLDGIGRALRRSPIWTLLDEQRLAFNIVRGLAGRAAATGEKSVLIVTGGPGTGKSVIAVHLLVALSAGGRHAVYHATGSKAFTTNLRALAPSSGSAVFKYFNNFLQGA